jgi:hypothetical protein
VRIVQQVRELLAIIGVFSETTHSCAALSLAASPLPLWYSLAVGSGRQDAASNLLYAPPI